MKTGLTIFLFVFSAYNLLSQSTIHDTIREVTIKEKKVQVAQGTTQQIDTSVSVFYQHASLQQLLQMHTNVFVKNYGVGSLSTVSIRGSSAAQTQVVWNGININNAMTGLSDFSALPVSFFDHIDIEYGSNTQHPVVGGSILLSNNKPSFYHQKKGSLSIGYESLKNYSASLASTYSTTRLSNQFRFNMSNAKNEYSFFNPDKNHIEKSAHSKSHQLSLLNDFYYKLNGNNILSLHLWAQDQQHEIPPATFENESQKTEHTSFLRTIINWEQRKTPKYTQLLSLGYFYEKYQYEDSSIQIVSNASVVSIPFSEIFTYQLLYNHKISIQCLANRSFMTNRTDAALNKGSLLLTYSIDNLFNRINMAASVQKEISDIFSLPVIGSISFSSQLTKGIKPYVSISSNYRTPTLNELYYYPGGNIHLRPETGKNIEGGLQLHKQIKKHELNTTITCYSRVVKNWITWYGSSILTPHNIQKVWSRGLDIISQYEFILSEKKNFLHDSIVVIQKNEVAPKYSTSKGYQKKSILLGILYTYTLSTTEESAIANDYSIGKQIPYVPRYQIKGTIGIKWNEVELNYVETYTGYRFVTTDESQYLQPFFTGNLFASYSIRMKKNVVQTTFRLNNIFNANYESIVGRMMPLRNCSIGLTWKLNSL